ncbi:hypothetical protein MN608_11416 [Microdochium nivale]|nr:hypothetical protein MN608_11416 [Microdochium nivale]
MLLNANILAVAAAALMAAAPVLAAPQHLTQRADTSIRVKLSDNAQEFERQLDFTASKGKADQTITTGGKFVQVELQIGANVANQALRCQAVGPDGKVVLLNRGQNKNKATFGDGGGSNWVVVGGKPVAIAKVTCSPKFV